MACFAIMMHIFENGHMSRITELKQYYNEF